jgi:hypothetical protein
MSTEPPLNQHLLAHLERIERMVKRYHESLREEARLDDLAFGGKSSEHHPDSERQVKPRSSFPGGGCC